MFQKQLNAFKISAESGLVYYLAECYLSGIGVEKNEKLAIELFQETLKIGYIWSADRLSDVYHYAKIRRKIMKRGEYYGRKRSFTRLFISSICICS